MIREKTSALLLGLGLLHILPASGFEMEEIIDATRAGTRYSFESDFDESDSQLSYSQSYFRTFYNKPIQFGDSWIFFNYLSADHTRLNLQGPHLYGANADGLESDLFRLSLPFGLVNSRPDSRWTYGLWANPTLASDFSDVGGDDFFLDLGAGFGYRFSDDLLLGLGVYSGDVTEDPSLIGGPFFIWTPCDQWMVSFYGPRFLARYNWSEQTQIGFEIASRGGKWNLDAEGESRKLRLQNWQSGLFLRQNVYQDLWMQVGAGYSFAQKLELTERDGDSFLPETDGDLDGSPYVYLSFDVASW